ncbi:MAG: glycoside hydrolase family 2 protein [Microbacteriaceae bacterium]
MDIIPGSAASSETFRASQQDGTYPRPQLLRTRWADLDGEWGFRYDDDDIGLAEKWYQNPRFDRRITVPFPPESIASGIGDTGYHPVVWYQRDLTADDLAAAGLDQASPRLLLHFGAVDYRAQVWLNGSYLGSHEGGHTPFHFDLTGTADPTRESQTLVVRAEDLPRDVAQARGKQDWLPEPHAVWYDRTTGIWQPVWLEAVPELAVESLQWATDLTTASVQLTLRLNGRRSEQTDATVTISYGDDVLVVQSTKTHSRELVLTFELHGQSNGQAYERLLWSPEHPRLLDAAITVSTPGSTDTVYSYFGIRSAATGYGRFLLNDRPYYLRSVLSQGFWPQTHLACPSADALRAEAQLIKDLGFNAVRVHQKIEDPRLLFWTDKLGLLVWAEMPSALEFSPLAVGRVIAEWSEALQRDRSHPSIVTWVPLNESWGVQHIAHDPAMQAYASALVQLTKAYDQSRPVISNDGWEHMDSDIVSIHDYESSPPVVRERYADVTARDALLAGIGPAGRRILLDRTQHPEDGPDQKPVMLTEFGGVRFTPDKTVPGGWGYSSATSAEDFAERLGGLMDAVRASTFLAGFCYTQLTDTQQEANGLCDENRIPKLPIEVLARIVSGHG